LIAFDRRAFVKWKGDYYLMILTYKDTQPRVEVEQYEPWILLFVEPSLPQTDQYAD
jgi:hypothetical protein